MHKIGSYWADVRGKIYQKFLSHGTPLGYLGSLSPKPQSRAKKNLYFLHDFIPNMKNFKDFWMVKTPIPISMYINCD